ncbi:GTPase ObgE [Candidatus Nomurabacteria bacterium]|nr:GTPase ObgE [Candidatus Nomurabacteria bacterium]
MDEITIQATAGKGGNGIVSWRREKFIAKGGPNGGDGGRGGNVYIKAIRSLRVLDQYRAKKEFFAENGEAGGSRSFKGANGEDLYIEFPIGSKITNKSSDQEYELTQEGQEILILRGGAGGYGNEHFKSSTNQTPKEATPGKEGEFAELHIEVSLIADVGLVGFPNAGKSSLLNTLTNAQAKVGAYPFTTIDPNLGDLYGYIIADIPGLIEGASGGKGLGYTFLRHITKTKIILHLISFEQEDMMGAYKTIRKELEDYGHGLSEKTEVILLTKTDMTNPETIKKSKEEFEKLGKKVFDITLFDDKAIKSFSDELIHFLKNKE